MISPAMTPELIRTQSEDLHPSIRQYIESLDRSLMREFPGDERRVLVEEAAFILESLLNERLILGASMDEAIDYALMTFGGQAAIATAHRIGKFESKPTSGLIRFIGRANAIALGYLGIGTLAVMTLIQIRIYVPSGEALKIPFTPAQVRSVLPEPLPFPQNSPLFYWMLGIAILAPFVLGWLVGLQIPVKAAAAVYRGLLPIILTSFLFGCGLLPNTEGLLFAIWQLVFWLPVAALCAYLSSSRVRNFVPPA